MKLWWSVMVLAACSVDLGYERTTMEFDYVSPPRPGGGDSPMVAAGTTILTNTHISYDDGAGWREKNPAIDTQFPQIWNEEQLLVFTTAFGWGRWSRIDDQVVSINPPFSPAGIHLAKHDGAIHINQGGTRMMARQTAAGVWSQSTLPDPPSSPGVGITVHDIVAMPDAVFVIASSGLYRSGDNGGSWGWVNDPGIAGAKFLTLPDGRIALLNPSFNQILNVIDSNGTLQNISSPQFPSNGGERFRPFSCLGAIIDRGKYSTDLGMTWKDILPAMPGVSWTVDRSTCGGNYIAMHITDPVKWLVKVTAFEQLDFIYSYSPNPSSGSLSGTPYLFVKSGTILVDGFAWKLGDAWRIRFLPPNVPIYALSDGSLWGTSGTSVYRSTDDGATWTTTTVPVAVPGFDGVYAKSDGTMFGRLRGPSTTGTTLDAKLWRSTDQGLTWTQVSQTAPLLEAVATDGTLVGTHGLYFYLSRDDGATWSTEEPMPLGYKFLMLTNKNKGLSYDQNDDPFQDRDEPDNHTDGAPSFHLWDDYGAGLTYRQVTPLVPARDPDTMEMTYLPADLSPVQSTFAVDAEGYVWWYGGMPVAGAWRSHRPMD